MPNQKVGYVKEVTPKRSEECADLTFSREVGASTSNRLSERWTLMLIRSASEVGGQVGCLPCHCPESGRHTCIVAC